MLDSIGNKVLLIETDTNYTLNTIRKMELFKTGAKEDQLFTILASVDEKISEELESLKKKKYDYIILDTAGKTTDNSIKKICVVSDLVIVPTSLSQNDLLVTFQTIEDLETGAFMRDVRTKGETPLHRAAAYADEKTISYLIDNGADKTVKDANGNSPLSWASEHLRPGTILSLLTYDGFQISEGHKTINTSDHGQGWGNSMDWKLLGDYLPE
jgi:hypothetical protein